MYKADESLDRRFFAIFRKSQDHIFIQGLPARRVAAEDRADHFPETFLVAGQFVQSRQHKRNIYLRDTGFGTFERRIKITACRRQMFPFSMLRNPEMHQAL